MFRSKLLYEVEDDLEPTQDGEASEEAHCPSNKSQLSFDCHLQVRFSTPNKIVNCKQDFQRQARFSTPSKIFNSKQYKHFFNIFHLHISLNLVEGCCSNVNVHRFKGCISFQ